VNLILKTCETKELKTPEDVRGILKQEYNTNNIRGAILVGQIPFALWEQGYGDNRGILSLFYEDLDGEFQDRDNDGFYDYHVFGENEGPEIWICWMRPPKLLEVFHLNRFLDKVHNYYIRKTEVEDKAFVACHEDYDNNFYGPLGVVPPLEKLCSIVEKDGEGRDITVSYEIWLKLSGK